MCYQFSFKNATSASDKLQDIGLAGVERGTQLKGYKLRTLAHYKNFSSTFTLVYFRMRYLKF